MGVVKLILRCVGVLLLTAIVLGITNGAGWVFGIGAGALFFCIILYMIERDDSPKALAIMSFIGTVGAAIVRVAIGGAGGICFYVVASITNAATCYCIGYGDVLRDEENFDNQYHYDYGYYAEQKYERQKSEKFWRIVNCAIFGVLALIGCFKPYAAFLPLIYIVLRYLLVWFRNR